MLKVLPNGKSKQAVTWGNADNEVGWAITVGLDGNLYISATASSGPPFMFSRACKSMKTPTSEFNVPVGTVTTPAATTVDPDATVTTPVGSTVYAGGTEGILLKLIP